jgi:hypothetical protein
VRYKVLSCTPSLQWETCNKRVHHKTCEIHNIVFSYAMETQKLCGKSLSEYRFRKVLFVLRMVGIPLNIPSVSRVHSVYNGVIVVCFYMTYSACLMDLILSESDFEDKMKTFRVLLGIQFIMLFHLFFRYLSFPQSIVRFLNYKSVVLCRKIFNLNKH